MFNLNIILTPNQTSYAISKLKQSQMQRILVLFLIIILAQITAQAKPYLPSSPDQVLEKLPFNLQSSVNQISVLRKQLTAKPNDLSLATKLAKHYIEQSRVEGDPRYLGYAQAALSPWWALEKPPVEVLVLRATLLQSTHQFDAALADLDKVLQIDNSNGQAWITRATILQVQGKYVDALKSCDQLKSLAPALITLTCVSNIQNLNGQAASSYQTLKSAFEKNTDKNVGIDIWVLTLLAEMANRLGEYGAAEEYFTSAIALENTDSYLLGAYADYLLDRNRPQTVVELLKNKINIDALLLRYAEALKMLDAKQAKTHIAHLNQNFAAVALRGDTVHLREQARFELKLMRNPARALALAKNNWQTQKEPADARVYLESALAANNKSELQIIKQWIAKNKLQDAALDKLIPNNGLTK